MRTALTAAQLLEDLLAAGAILAMADGKLQLEAPPGVLTPERRVALAHHRVVLRHLVAQRWRSREDCGARYPCPRMSRCRLPVDGRPCGIPATCCVCGAGLPPDHQLLCSICSAEFISDRTQWKQGVPS